MNTINIKSYFIVFIFTMIAFCCESSLPTQVVSNEELINRTKNIYLAEVDSINKHAAKGLYEYKITVVEVLKGISLEKITILSLNTGAESNSFSDHTDSIFWKTNVGRLTYWPDCRIHPGFTIGKLYLIFFSTPGLYHNKSFEQIDNVKIDKWYDYIRKKVKY